MQLTPLAKGFITVVVLGVVGYVGYANYGDQVRNWANDRPVDAPVAAPTKPQEVSKDDFAALSGKPADAERDSAKPNLAALSTAKGKLDRPLVVAINTWAGHAPGVVFNRGLEPSDRSLYKGKYGIDVRFILLEDPAAKLAAFRKGDVDIMWDTVDNWAREASTLAEGTQKAKSILLQDWSRGGDGVVSLAAIRSIEELKGKKVACTQFTPSHFLLLFLLSQSGLSADERREIENNIVFTQDAPAAAAMFKAGRVDAAVTWEPDLSGAVAARGEEAHVLVSTAAATNVIADTLVARDEVINQAPETVQGFVTGWFEGIDQMRLDPAASHSIVGEALKLDGETVSGMLSGLKLTPYADNALFYGLNGGKSHFETLFDTAFVIWRKKGLVTRAVAAKDWVDPRFIAALAPANPQAKVEEAKIEPKAPSKNDRAIINKQIQIHFTPGSDQIMEGSYFVLDSLGETMIAFGNTYLRVEGNTDATGSAAVNKTLSQKRAEAVKAYLLKEFPGLAPQRFQTIGHGAENPVAPNNSESGRQLNRRTDIKVVLAEN